ncbi:MAG: ATPase, T2SS/T4P/T4SS family, partial [Methanobacteriaceae archaeon]|nr:ATPase, T2SS/T4P/T4SS family [Methanobacteriaceae archaeon]
MKQKRKDILKDLLGEFGSEDYDEIEKESEDNEKPAEVDEPVIPEEKPFNIIEDNEEEEEDEDSFNIEKIMERQVKPQKTIKKSTDHSRAEIIEEELVPEYNISVPNFSDNERLLLNEIREKLVEVAVSKGDDFRIDESSFIKEVKEFLRMKGVRNIDKLSAQISQEMLGYGELDPLIKDDDLEEIMVIGIKRPVFVYHRKIGMMVTNVVFEDDKDIKSLIDVIARQVNRRIDQQTPILDARLPDGSRVNATIPPVSADGSSLTIRKFKKDPLTVIDLINFKTMSS